MVYFKGLSQHSPGETEKDNENDRIAGNWVFPPKLEKLRFALIIYLPFPDVMKSARALHVGRFKMP